jgi:hypothetical protein
LAVRRAVRWNSLVDGEAVGAAVTRAGDGFSASY